MEICSTISAARKKIAGSILEAVYTRYNCNVVVIVVMIVYVWWVLDFVFIPLPI